MLRTLSLAEKFGYRFDERLVGLNINQPDFPWWWEGILQWLKMVRDMQDAFGENANAWRGIISAIIESGDPREVYTQYRDYCLYAEREIRRNS